MEGGTGLHSRAHDIPWNPHRPFGYRWTYAKNEDPLALRGSLAKGMLMGSVGNVIGELGF